MPDNTQNEGAGLGLSIDIGISEVSDTSGMPKATGHIEKLVETVDKVGAAAAKLQPILATVSQSLDDLSGKGIAYSSIKRDTAIPMIGSVDYISKDIKAVGTEVVKELHNMIEAVVTEVGLMGDRFKQTLQPVLVEARQVKRAARNTIVFNQEMGVDTIENINIISQKEFDRKSRLSIEEEEAVSKDFSDLVQDIQSKQQVIHELSRAKNAETIAELNAFRDKLDSRITKLSIKHSVDIDTVTQSVTAGDDIQEDAIRALIDNAQGGKGRPPVDLSSTRILGYEGKTEDDTATVQTAIAQALSSYPNYKKGLRELRPLEKQLRQLIRKKGVDPIELQTVLNQFMQAYNKIAVTSSNIEDSIVTLMSSDLLPASSQALADIQESTKIINDSMALSLLDFKTTVVEPLPPRPVPRSMNKLQATSYIKANPRNYNEVIEGVRQAQATAAEFNRFYLDIETAPNGIITHANILGGTVNELFTHKEQPGMYSDWHLENIVHEALNPVNAAKSRGSVLNDQDTRAKALLAMVKVLRDNPGVEVATYGDTDLEIIINNMEDLVTVAKSKTEREALTDGIDTIRQVQRTRFVNVMDKVRTVLNQLAPGYFENTVQSKGLSALIPLVQIEIPSADKFQPHIPTDDNALTAIVDKLFSGPNAAMELFFSKDSLGKGVDDRRVRPEFTNYLLHVLESPLYKYAKLVDRLRRLPLDNISNRVPIEQEMRDLELASSNVRTLGEEGVNRILESIGFIESHFRPQSVKLDPVVIQTVSELERAIRSSLVLEQAITQVVNSVAAPLDRGATPQTLKNSIDKSLLDKIFRSIPKKDGASNTPTSDLVNEMFSKDGMLALAGAGPKVVKSFIYEYLLKYSAVSDFNGFQLDKAEYINALNTRLAVANYNPNAGIDRIIPAKDDAIGNMMSNDLVHAGEAKAFLEFLQNRGGTIAPYAQLKAEFEQFKAENPSRFATHHGFYGEGTETAINAILSNLPNSGIIGGKTSLVGASKDLSGGFGMAISGHTADGTKQPILFGRPDALFVDAGNGLGPETKLLTLDAKLRSRAKSAQEVMDSLADDFQQLLYTVFRLPTGVAVKTNNNILEIALNDLAGKVDSTILEHIKVIGRAIGLDFTHFTVEIFGDLEGTLQKLLNVMAKDMKVVAPTARSVIEANQLYGVSPPTAPTFTADAQVLARNIAAQMFQPIVEYGKQQNIFSEQSAARLLGTTAIQPDVLTGLPQNGVVADRVAFDAINSLIQKLRINIEGLTTGELTTGLLGRAGGGLTVGSGVALTHDDFVKNLIKAIDTVSNLSVSNPQEARAYLKDGGALVSNLVPQDLISKTTKGIQNAITAVEDAIIIDAKNVARGSKSLRNIGKDKTEDELLAAADANLTVSTEDTRHKLLPATSGGGAGGGDKLPPQPPPPPLDRDSIIDAFPDAAKEYRVAAGTVGIQEEMYGKSLSLTQAKAKAAADEINRLTALVATAVNATFLDDAQKDFLAFDITLRETSLGFDALKRAQSSSAKGELQVKGLDRSIAGLEAERMVLETLDKAKRIIPNSDQDVRLKELPGILDSAKARRANVAEKTRISQGEVEYWKERMAPPEGVEPKQFYTNFLKQAEAMADRASAKEKIDLYKNHSETLLAAVGPQKTEANKLVQQDAMRALNLDTVSNADSLMSQKALVTALRVEYASLDTVVAKYGTSANKEFAATSDKVKQQIELVKLLEKDKQSLEGKLAKQNAVLEVGGQTQEQRTSSKQAAGRLTYALDLNNTQTEQAITKLKTLLGELDAKAIAAKQSLSAAMRLDYDMSVTKRKEAISGELDILAAKHAEGLSTPGDALRKAQLNYESATLSKKDVSDSYAALLERENKNRYTLNARSQGYEQSNMFKTLQANFGEKDNGLFQSLLSDYSRTLTTQRNTASPIGSSVDTVEQKIKELHRIEAEIARGKAEGKQVIPAKLQFNWDEAKKEVEAELHKLKTLIDTEFQQSLNPAKRVELYKQQQKDSIDGLVKQKQLIEADMAAGVSKPSQQKELQKINAELLAKSDTGDSYAKSVLAQLSAVKNPFEKLHIDEVLKTLGTGLSNQTRPSTEYSKVLEQLTSELAKGFSGKTSPVEDKLLKLSTALRNRDVLDKNLEQYKGVDIAKLSPAEQFNFTDLTAQRANEQRRAERLQRVLPRAIEKERETELTQTSIEASRDGLNAKIRKSLELEKQELEVYKALNLATTEQLQKLTEIEHKLALISSKPLTARQQYDADIAKSQGTTANNLKSLEADLAAGVMTPDKLKQLLQARSDSIMYDTSSGSGYMKSLLAMQKPVESPLVGLNANSSLKNLGFGTFADMKNPIDVLREQALVLARKTAESGPAYDANVDSLMTRIAQANTNKRAADDVVKSYAGIEYKDLAPHEKGNLRSATAQSRTEQATAERLLGELNVAIGKATQTELSNLPTRLTEAIAKLKEGLEYEKLWLEAENKLGLSTAEHAKRLVEVNLQLARMSSNVNEIRQANEASVVGIKSPLAGLRSDAFALRVSDRTKLQDIGISFKSDKGEAAKKVLEGLVSEFSKLDYVSNNYKSGGLEKSFSALQKNYELAKLYDMELIKVNATLAKEPHNAEAKLDKSIYLTLLKEQLALQDKLILAAKEQARIQHDLDMQPAVLQKAAQTKATAMLVDNAATEAQLRAKISAGIDLKDNLKKLQDLERDNIKLREAKAAGPAGLTSTGTAEDLAKLHGVDLGGQKRGAASFAEQVANMGTWWAEWTIGQNAMAVIPNALQAGIAFAKEFEAQLKNVELITQANKIQFEQLVGTISQLSTARIFSPKELAEGLIILGQAGFNAVQSMQLLPAITELATATLSNLKVAADIATTAIEAFNLPIERAGELSNTLAAITIESKLEINSLGTTFNYIAESAAGAGLSIEQVGTAMGIMSNAGVRASTIGTSLRSVLGTLMAPTPKFTAELGKIGMSVDDVNPRYRELGVILADLHNKGFNVQSAFEGLDKRIAGAITSLINNADDYQSFIGKISGTNRATTMAEGQMDTFDAQSKRLQHGMQLLGGETFGPVLLPMKEITGTLASVVEYINAMIGVIPVSARAVLGLGTAFGLAGTAIFTMVTGLKLLFATQSGGAAANIFKLITDKNVFNPAQSIIATGQTIPAGALASVTGVRRQFLEIIQSFINLQNIGVALVAASAAALTYKGVQKISGKDDVNEARHTADVAGTYATELTNLEKILTTVTDKTALYHVSLKKLREEFGLLSIAQLKTAASNARITALDTDIAALDASAKQKVNPWSDFFTTKSGRKEKAKSAADDATQSLKKQGLYYTGSDTEVIEYLDKNNTDKTILGSMTTEEVLLQRNEDLSKPDVQQRRLAEARLKLLQDSARLKRLTSFDEISRTSNDELNDRSLSPLISVSSFGPGKEDFVSVKKAFTGSVGGELQKKRDNRLAELKNVIADAGLTGATTGVSDEMLITMYRKHLSGTAKGAIYDNQLKAVFDAIGKDTSKLDSKLALDSSKYLMEKGAQTGIVYSGAQLALIEELKTSKTKWLELKDKVKNETDAGLKAIWEDDLATAESTMKRLAKSSAMLLIEKLPGFENAKNIPKGVIQTLDQFVPYINSGVTANMDPIEMAAKQAFNTSQLKGVSAADLPEAGQKLKAVKEKYEKILAESGLAKFDPKKAGEEWSKKHEVYFTLQARMDLELQDTVEGIITAGWARIEPKLAKVKTALQDMLKLKQMNIELGFSTTMNDVNVNALQSTVDYLNAARPQTNAIVNKAGIDITTHTGEYLRMAQGYDWTSDNARNNMFTNFQAQGKNLDLGNEPGLRVDVNPVVPGTGRYTQARLQTRHENPFNQQDYTTYSNPDDISYNWRNAGGFTPYYMRGGVDQLQEFRISQRKEFETIQADLQRGEELSRAKMQTAIASYGYDLGTYTSTSTEMPKQEAKFDFFGKLPKDGLLKEASAQARAKQQLEYIQLSGVLGPGYAGPYQPGGPGSEYLPVSLTPPEYQPVGKEYKRPLTEIEKVIEATKTEKDPVALLASVKKMEELALLDRSKALQEVQSVQAKIDATARKKAELQGTLTSGKPITDPEMAQAVQTNAELQSAESLGAELDAAKAKVLDFNTVVTDKIIAARKNVFTAVAEAQKEELGTIYSALQKEVQMQVNAAKKIEELRTYRAQIKTEAQGVMETFAKATGDWKEPSAGEKQSTVSRLGQGVEDAMAEGKLEEAKRAYAKFKETALKYANDGSLGVDEKRQIGDRFASVSSNFDGLIQKEERKTQQEADEYKSKLDPVIKERLAKLKESLMGPDGTMKSLESMSGTEKEKYVNNLEKYKSVEKMSNMTAEEIGKMGSDERMKVLFDKDRMDIDGFNKATQKFADAIDVILKRAEETSGVKKLDKDGKVIEDKSMAGAGIEIGFKDGAGDVLFAQMKSKVKDAAKEAVREDISGIGG